MCRGADVACAWHKCAYVERERARACGADVPMLRGRDLVRPLVRCCQLHVWVHDILIV